MDRSDGTSTDSVGLLSTGEPPALPAATLQPEIDTGVLARDTGEEPYGYGLLLLLGQAW